MQAEGLLDLEFHGQAVAVPPRYVWNDLAAVHDMISEERIFDYAREHVTYVRVVVCGRRALAENKRFPPAHPFLNHPEDALILPQTEGVLLHLWEGFPVRFHVVLLHRDRLLQRGSITNSAMGERIS